jgi:hypothetical protein
VSPADSQLPDAGSRSRAQWWGPVAFAALVFAGLAIYGARVHWVEAAGTAERDGYVHQAELIARGELPHDPFRPLLYPLLTAALAHLTGSAFAAARLISNVAAAVLVLLAFAYGKRLAGSTAGWWAVLLLLPNPNLWIIGQHTTTDMLFAAEGAAALLAGLVYLEDGGIGPAVLAGGALGLAAFTRGNALFLLPPLVASWLLAPGPFRRRSAHLFVAVAFGCLLLVPHWWLRALEFGDPFHDENWKNLAFKLHGYPDWSYFDRVPEAGLGGLLRNELPAILRGGLDELARFVVAGAPQLFGTWLNVLLVIAGAVLLGGAVAGRSAGASAPRAVSWLLASLGFFLLATAVSFFAWGRLLLLLLPGASGIAGAAIAVSCRRWTSSLRLAAAAVGALTVLVLAVKTVGYRLPAFAAEHPYREVAVLRQLDATSPPEAVLAGSSPFLGRYLHHRYIDLPDAFGRELTDPALYYRRLDAILARERVSYAVFGMVDLRDRPRALVTGAMALPGLALISAKQGVAVWRVVEVWTHVGPRSRSTANGPAQR